MLANLKTLNMIVIRMFLCTYKSSYVFTILSALFGMSDIACCVYYTGESCVEVNIEAESNITEHPRDEKPRLYLCTVCDKRFTSKGGLCYHKASHTGGQLYSCTQCEKCFTHQRYLKRHMNVHSSKYKCTECGKCFSSNQALTVHRRSHSGEKPFECTVCSKQFTSSGDLVRHCRIHSGEKPYKCHLCDKTFSQCGELNTHMRVQTVQVFTV